MKDLKVFSKAKFRRQLLSDAWSCASVNRVMLCTCRQPATREEVEQYLVKEK